VLEKNGQKRFFSLSRAGSFNVFEPESIPLAVGDRIRITKNFQSQGKKFRNNGLHTVTAIEDGKITLDNTEIIPRGGLHIDQGFAVTSHAAQGKTVDQVIVSVPVEAFSQANEAQFYVSMSRARESMHLFTDSKVALKEAVARPSSRLSPLELVAGDGAEVIARMQSASRSLRSSSKDHVQRRDIDQEQERGMER
jgi:hypothetical protein